MYLGSISQPKTVFHHGDKKMLLCRDRKKNLVLMFPVKFELPLTLSLLIYYNLLIYFDPKYK